VHPTPPAGHDKPSTAGEIHAIKALPSTGQAKSSGYSANWMFLLLMTSTALFCTALVVRQRRDREEQLEKTRVRVRTRRMRQ
jgi:hypothetical protein